MNIVHGLGKFYIKQQYDNEINIPVIKTYKTNYPQKSINQVASIRV